jgi:tetratricopeptide (TPR) repeat protein
MSEPTPMGKSLGQQTAVSPPVTNEWWTKPWLLALVLVIVTFMVYSPALRGGFVFDDAMITDNRLIKAGDGLRRFWFTTEAPDYYPLTWSLWWLEWRLWGDNAAGYHVVNVLFHGVNAVMVWLVLRRLKIPGAWLTGLVFALHPVNVVTVAWIIEQKNTLSMLFCGAAVLLYLRFDEQDQKHWYILSLTTFLLALLSKTAVVMLPVVLLGCMWWQHGRVRQKDWLRSLPFLGLSVILGLATIWFHYTHVLTRISPRAGGFPSRLAAAGWVPWFYLYKAIWPLNLMMIYPLRAVDASRWISWIPGLVLTTCFFVFWRKRQTWGRPLLFGLGYFVVMLFPVLGFFDQSFFRSTLVADHWQYGAIIGVIALVIAAGVSLCRRLGPSGRYVGPLAAAAVLVDLGTASWGRCGVYENNEALWRDTLAKNPNAWLAHNNLGYVLANQGDLVSATWHYQEALRLEPRYPEAHNNLGNALIQVGKIQEAIGHYEQALRIDPDYANAHNNLGNALERTGKIEEAIGQYEQALRIDPDSVGFHYNLAIALEETGRVPEAVAHYEQALRIKPDLVNARNALARLRALP